MTSQRGKPVIIVHIILTISESNGNQKTKFGQFMEYNKKNIFLQKLCKSCKNVVER